MGTLASDPATASLYDEDFFAWTQRTAELIRARRFDAVDVENVAEEVESMGKSHRLQVESRLEVVITHLLKWVHQPRRRSRSWRKTLLTQRRRLLRILDLSPSLRRQVGEMLPSAHRHAVKVAVLETGLPPATFPSSYPFAPEQLLDVDFLPD